MLQALRLLKKDGFVIDAGRRGLRVVPLEAPAIIHVYEVRVVLDALAARWAARARAQFDPMVIAAGRTAAAGQRIGPMIYAATAGGVSMIPPHVRAVDRPEVRELAEKLLSIRRDQYDCMKLCTESMQGIIDDVSAQGDEHIVNPGDDLMSIPG